jgi:Cytochrome P460
MRWRIVGLLLGAWTGTVQAQDLVITEQSVFSFYKSLHLLTPEPINVSGPIAVACSSTVIAAERQRAGPHFDTPVNLYADELARKAIDDKAALFPRGAVIVKEKLADGKMTAVGGMVKRAPGYDPANGDWEYFYAAQSGGFATGRLDHCVACHAKATATDHVFPVGTRAIK